MNKFTTWKIIIKKKSEFIKYFLGKINSETNPINAKNLCHTLLEVLQTKCYSAALIT